MDVVADLPADEQAAEPVQQRDRSFDHPPMRARPLVAGGGRGADPRPSFGLWADCAR
jgi:hypothetical protein